MSDTKSKKSKKRGGKATSPTTKMDTEPQSGGTEEVPRLYPLEKPYEQCVAEWRLLGHKTKELVKSFISGLLGKAQELSEELKAAKRQLATLVEANSALGGELHALKAKRIRRSSDAAEEDAVAGARDWTEPPGSPPRKKAQARAAPPDERSPQPRGAADAETAKKQKPGPAAATRPISTLQHRPARATTPPQAAAKTQGQAADLPLPRQETRNNAATKMDVVTESTKPTSQTRSLSGRTPTVVLRNKEAYMQLFCSELLKDVNLGMSKTTAEGIRMRPTTRDDHRKLTAALDAMKLAYHTYALPEDKPLKVVIKGLAGVDLNTVAQKIADKTNAAPRTISWMKNRRTGTRLDMVLATFARADREAVFQLRRLCGLAVTVEKYEARGPAGQCFNCQLHGHVQANCKAPTRCVKCGGPHRPRHCTLKREDSCKCANCGGAHPASYKGCKKNPANRRSPTKKTDNPRTTAAKQGPIQAKPADNGRRATHSASREPSSQATPAPNPARTFAEVAAATSAELRREDVRPMGSPIIVYLD